MNCSGPGATHHLACDCREREWAERLAQTDRALFAERERVVRAELRAASLSQELLAAEKAREAWTETARMHAKNEAYYRDLIVRTLSGTPAAFVSDDGSVQQDVICAKLPELYAASEKAREEADAYAGRANARIADLGERLDATEAVLRDAEKARKEAERERDEARAQVLALKELHVVDGRIDAKIAGEGVRALALGLAEFVRDIGAENYVEMKATTPDGRESFTVTVQRAGEVTPHEARLAAEAERDQLRERLDKEGRMSHEQRS